MFDLPSEDPASAAEFERLYRRYEDDAMALIRFVVRNGDALIATLTERGSAP